MRVTDEALQEFMSIYAEQFGETISHAQASEMAQRILALYRLLRQALPGTTINADAVSKFEHLDVA
jgi:hypothetical protein